VSAETTATPIPAAVAPPGEAPAAPSRYHALDSLRGCMMLLGLVLHSAMSYLSQPTEVWPFRDGGSVAFDLFVFYVHIFRMPVFFVMSGFFAALVMDRRGARALAANRAKRILGPLAVGWLLLFPITSLGFAYGMALQSPVGWDAVVDRRGETQSHILMHLWFLYYLAIFYAVSLPVVLIARRLRDRVAFDPGRLVRRGLQSPWRALLFAVPTILTLYPMQKGLLETHASLTPAPRILLAYLVFFTFGWLLYGQRDLLETFTRRARLQMALTVPLFVGVLVGVSQMPHETEWGAPGPRLLVATLSGIITWFCIFGITGLFLRYGSQPSFTGRYLADASYWLYLTHIPLTIWLPVLLSRTALPIGIKFLIVLTGTVAVTLLTYDLLVRNTMIGAALNGKRYPRLLPGLGRRPAPVLAANERE